MKKQKIFIPVTLLILMLLSFTSSYAQLQKFTLQEREYRFENGKWFTFFEGKIGDEIIPERLIVQLKDKSYIENFDFQRLDIEDISLASPRFLEGFYVLSINPKSSPIEIALTLERTGLFEVLEFDAIGKRHITPGDPMFNQQWNLTKVKMPEAWDISTGNSSIILGVIDSGIKYTHEDIDGNIWINPSEDRNGNGLPDFYSYSQGGDLDGIDNDGNGYVDDLIRMGFCRWRK